MSDPQAVAAIPPTLRRVTFDVDTAKLFDQLRAMGGDFSPLGCRVVGSLLSGTGLVEALGMAIYGVYVVEPAHDR
jgi:hypothetical protein